jgi:hypothetical protein
MQKVVGSNPISRSPSMSEQERKGARSKTRRGRRRTRAAQSRKRDEETAKSAASAETEASAKESQPAKGAKAPEPAPEESRNVSSLLETSGEEVKQLLAAADEAAAKIREAAQAEAAPGADTSERNEAVSLVSRTNAEVQKVLESAEEAGEKIREEARVEARQLIDETRRQAQSTATEQMDRVSQMTEQLLGELTGVQERLERLRSAFDQAMESMSREISRTPTDVWDAKNGVPGEEDAADLRRRLGRRRSKMVPQKEPAGISEGARLLALQQLMAGVDAAVIEERLTKEFGIKDPKPILDWMGVEGHTPADRRKNPEKS